MAHVIRSSGLVDARRLKVDIDRVQFVEGGLWGKKKFTFNQIGCVLMSPSHELSFQVGNEVFSIPTKPYNAKHQAAIDALVQGVRRSAGDAATY